MTFILYALALKKQKKEEDQAEIAERKRERKKAAEAKRQLKTNKRAAAKGIKEGAWECSLEAPARGVTGEKEKKVRWERESKQASVTRKLLDYSTIDIAVDMNE